MAKSSPSGFRFKSTDSIGAAAAEDDAEFLTECWVDTGALSLLCHLQDNRLIVLGRTGSGKSALLTALEDGCGEHVIRISPEQLALTYVANSTILNFFASIGVNLDPFFKLLWRHVLTVEILVRHFSSEDETHRRSLLDRLKNHFLGPSKSDKEMRQAVDYLEEWGRSFWEDTEFRVKEITSQVETKLDAQVRATLGPKAAALGATAGAAEKFTEGERSELISRGQDIVSRAQVQDLHKVLRLLDTVLDNKHNHYYLIIDGLDENWVEERLRYKLIMALMQTARDFNGVRHAKVVVALRRDLIDRVFRLTRDSGFQEEKFQSLYLPLIWHRDDILAILDKRIDLLVSRRYTKGSVGHTDLMPRQFRRMPIGDYIFEMAPRPRDVIAFFNACIAAAVNQPKISANELKLAEGEYSRGRLRALADEWSADYPTLADFAKVLNHRPQSFKVKAITDENIIDICLAVCGDHPGELGLLGSAMQVVEGAIPPRVFKMVLVQTFYQVGLVGLKMAAHTRESTADEMGRSVSFAEIDDETSIVVRPQYRRALGTRETQA